MSVTFDKIDTNITPIVEIDTEAPAAYIRLSSNPVAKTIVLRDDDILSTMDLDGDGSVVGIEVVWPTEFGVEKLIADSRADLVLPRRVLLRTRYVPAMRSTRPKAEKR